MNILPTEQVVEHTATLNNDLGFISYPVEHPKLLLKEVLEDQLVIIAAPDHPLTHKQTFAPHLGQRHIQDFIPFGFDDGQFNGQFRVDGFDSIFYPVGLPQGKCTAPCTNGNRMFHI